MTFSESHSDAGRVPEPLLQVGRTAPASGWRGCPPM